MQSKNINFIKESNIKITFTNKEIVSYGGFVLLAKLFENLKFKDHISGIFPIEEKSNNSTGIFSKVLKFGLTVLAGGKRFSHSLYLGESLNVYQKLFGVEKMIKSDTPLTRLFGRIKTFKLATMFGGKLWKYIYDKIIPFNVIKEDYLNFDSTVITRYGKQEGANKGYNSKKRGRPSHHPQIAFLNRTRYIVNLWNRQGKSGSNNNIVAFARETVEGLRNKLKIKGTIADTGYYLLDFLKYLESEKVAYIIGVPIARTIQRAISEIIDWTEVAHGISVGEFSFRHKTAGWDKNRRYIVVRQDNEILVTAKGHQMSFFKEDELFSKYRFGCYVTTFDSTQVDIWRTYRLRADDENRIKENKEDFSMEGFCMDSFYATEAAMLIRILFYNIINLFRNCILPQREKGKTFATIRKEYFIIPAIMGSSGRINILRLGIKSRHLRLKFKWLLNAIEKAYGHIVPNILHLTENIVT